MIDRGVRLYWDRQDRKERKAKEALEGIGKDDSELSYN